MKNGTSNYLDVPFSLIDLQAHLKGVLQEDADKSLYSTSCAREEVASSLMRSIRRSKLSFFS